MKKLKYITIIIIVLAILIFAFMNITKWQQKKINYLKEKIALLKEENTPLKFVVTERTDENFTVNIYFFDADEKIISQTKQQIQGKELFLDFYVIPVKDKFIAFPYKVFSNTIPPKNGIKLTEFYDNNGFPEVFAYNNIDNDLKIGLSKIFDKIKVGNVDSIQNQFGSVVHDLDGIKKFRLGWKYKVVVHTKGGIEIIEE